jgi:hypothetical protein
MGNQSGAKGMNLYPQPAGHVVKGKSDRSDKMCQQYYSWIQLSPLAQLPQVISCWQ